MSMEYDGIFRRLRFSRGRGLQLAASHRSAAFFAGDSRSGYRATDLTPCIRLIPLQRGPDGFNDMLHLTQSRGPPSRWFHPTMKGLWQLEVGPDFWVSEKHKLVWRRYYHRLESSWLLPFVEHAGL
jgi:hypothetical protein